MRARDYRFLGRAALTGNWGTAILVALVAGILGGSAGGGGGGGAGTLAGSSAGRAVVQNGYFAFDIPYFVYAVLAFFSVAILAWGLLIFLFGGAVTLGACQFNIDLVAKQRPARFSTLFSRFAYFGKALVLQLIIGLFVFLWSLLFIVPGIMAAYSYSMAGYIMAQNPDIGVMEALRFSKQLMRGNRARLFCLHISFIGWAFLCIFTFGIGFLFLAPYTNASVAAFYLDLTRQLPGAPSYQPPGAGYPGGQPGYPPPYAGAYAPPAPGYGPAPNYAPPQQPGYPPQQPGAYASPPPYPGQPPQPPHTGGV